MTEPVGFNASLDYTPYDADHDLCHAAAAAGPGPTGRGAEGAGGTPNAPPAPVEAQDCTTEVLKAVATCGVTVLVTKALTPVAALGVLGCAATAAEAIECLAEPEPKPQAP
ncbi:MAG TPA: hypothetical protein VI197_34835 [Polyangiaceae bacterium]